MKKSVEIIYKRNSKGCVCTIFLPSGENELSPVTSAPIPQGANLEIKITIKTDKKGYLERQCPKCGKIYKIEAEDWENNIRKESNIMHCPICGHIASSGHWHTEQQQEEIKKRLSDYSGNNMYKRAKKALEDLKKIYGTDYGIEIDYNPGLEKNIWHNPIDSIEELYTNYKCKKCNTRYAVIGSPFFCPCCGYYSIFNYFKGIEKRLIDLTKRKSKLIKQFGKDFTEDLYRDLIEKSLMSIVSSFQKLASDKYEEINGKLDGLNDFQNILKGSELFNQFGYDYKKWLNDEELNQLNIFFQQRHLIVHTNGIVNENYITKSGDTSYSIGERLVIKEPDVLRFLSIVKKLGQGLLSIRKSKLFYKK